MSLSGWVRLDNASNIFPAARSARDPKVFRLSAEMHAPVDPARLQRALETTFARYPLYSSILRRGLFWYYLQASDLRPQAEPETLPPCSAIWAPGYHGLLFRVLHHDRRISLEVFHALSDGTGALWFLTDLLEAYCTPSPVGAASSGSTPVQPAHALLADSFREHFRRRPAWSRPAAQDFQRAAQAPALAASAASDATAADSADAQAEPATPEAPPVLETPPTPAPGSPPVLRLRGTPTPDARTRAVELTMPAAAVLALAKAERVSLTNFLTALFLQSVRPDGEQRLGVVSVPVNLRQFFPSKSARNFFATVFVEAALTPADDPALSPSRTGEIARDLESQLRTHTRPAALEAKLRRLMALERSPFLRVMPRPVKDIILKAANARANRGLTVAISNLGRVTLPGPAAKQVRALGFQVSAARPQFCAISHADVLTVTFTSPFLEVDHVRRWVRALSSRGVDVTVTMPPATSEEADRAAAAPSTTAHGDDGQEAQG